MSEADVIDALAEQLRLGWAKPYPLARERAQELHEWLTESGYFVDAAKHARIVDLLNEQIRALREDLDAAYPRPASRKEG